MAETLLQIPKFSEGVINAITYDLFHSQPLQEKLEDIVRQRRGGDALQAAPGSLGASNPALLELLKQKQQEDDPLKALTQEAIASYSALWQKAQNHEALEEHGRAPLMHSVPHEGDSLVGIVLHNLEFGGSKLIRPIASNNVHLGDVYESQILYSEKKRPFLRLNLPGYDAAKERGGEPVSGKAYVVAASPWAGYHISLFIPNDRGHARVRMAVPEMADRWQFRGYESLSEVAVKLFREVIDTRQMSVETAALLYAALAAEEDGAKLHLREAFDKAFVQSPLGEEYPKAQPKASSEEADGHYKEIIGLARGLLSQMFYAPRSSLSLLEEKLERPAAFFRQKFQGADVKFAEAQFIVMNKDMLTGNRAFPLDVGIAAYATAEVVKAEGREKIWNNLYSRVVSLLEFFAARSPEAVLSADEFRQVSTAHNMFASYRGLSLPWQAVHILGEKEYTALVQEVVAGGLMGEPDDIDAQIWDMSKPGSVEEVRRESRDMDIRFLEYVPLSKLPAGALQRARFIAEHRSWGEEKAKMEPTFDLNKFYLLEAGNPVADAMERYHKAKAA